MRKLVFDPSSKYLLSLGHLHDGQVALWDWTRNKAIMKEQVVCEDESYVNDIAFSADG